jgi:hypothetical protein
MAANAGLVIKTPVVIPINVVIANPFRRPALTAPTPRKLTHPVKGTKATNVVANAVKIINRAFLIFCFIDSPFCFASSRITNWLSIPVPIVAIIPAILGKSKFHFIKDATPKIIKTSQKETATKANEVFRFRYLTKTKIKTEIIANNPALRIFFT